VILIVVGKYGIKCFLSKKNEENQISVVLEFLVFLLLKQSKRK